MASDLALHKSQSIWWLTCKKFKQCSLLLSRQHHVPAPSPCSLHTIPFPCCSSAGPRSFQGLFICFSSCPICTYPDISTTDSTITLSWQNNTVPDLGTWIVTCLFHFSALFVLWPSNSPYDHQTKIFALFCSCFIDRKFDYLFIAVSPTPSVYSPNSSQINESKNHCNKGDLF